MYTIRYTDPKLCGYVYRRKVRCGKPTCRCSKLEKYRHSAYYIQYREWVNGKWKRRSEYIPKKKVRAFRARIKRAKQREKETKEAVRLFLDQAPKLIRRLKNPDDFTAIADAKNLTDKALKIKPQNLKQLMQITSGIVNISAALLKVNQTSP
ncbi:MAG: hypothetical protein H8D67_30800 [Deltaproteobacteria bacterium]|nr:hypothetical protein [Deltaproteobacteria bacterium]